MLVREGLEDLAVRRRARLGALDHGKAQVLEQELGDLLWGREHEGLAGDGVGLVFDGGDLADERVAQALQAAHVDLDAGALHAPQEVF